MNEWLIELNDIGRGKMSGRIIVAASDLTKAKQEAVRECRKYIPGGKNLYLEAKGNRAYAVVSDLEDVGEITIRRLD
jgi:hypothetical protein